MFIHTPSALQIFNNDMTLKLKPNVESFCCEDGSDPCLLVVSLFKDNEWKTVHCEFQYHIEICGDFNIELISTDYIDEEGVVTGEKVMYFNGADNIEYYTILQVIDQELENYWQNLHRYDVDYDCTNGEW